MVGPVNPHNQEILLIDENHSVPGTQLTLSWCSSTTTTQNSALICGL